MPPLLQLLQEPSHACFDFGGRISGRFGSPMGDVAIGVRARFFVRIRSIRLAGRRQSDEHAHDQRGKSQHGGKRRGQLRERNR